MLVAIFSTCSRISCHQPQQDKQGKERESAQRVRGISPFVAEEDDDVVGYSGVQPNGDMLD